MNLPLPTDNLYKFTALAGVAICIFSFLTPMDRWSEFAKLLAETEADLVFLQAQVSNFNEDTQHKLKYPDSQVVRADELIDRSIKQRESLNKVERQISYAKSLRDLLMEQMRVFWSLFSLGLCMSLIGFLLWYIKVQRPQDLATEKSLGHSDINMQQGST
jgi:hypothetical protein